MYEEIWGQEYAEPKGYIANRGTNGFKHRFGGNSWTVEDQDRACGGPTLLLTLDLSDPRLSGNLPTEKIKELPLCSYINGSPWSKMQEFRIVPDEGRVLLTAREDTKLECPDPEYMLPTVLDEVPLSLREMDHDEYAIDEDSYYAAYRKWSGSSDGFLRVLGTPLLIDSINAACTRCGKEMAYIAGIGNELFGSGSFANGHEFFIGEGCLYFFLCPDCLHIQVQSQGT